MLSRYLEFTQSISAIYKSIQKLERKEMEHYGLKGPHVQCLVAVKEHPEGVTAAQLCTLCEKDKAAISRTLAELEQKQLLLRPAGYRASITLTPAGEQVTERIIHTATQAVRAVSGHIRDEDRPKFYEALELISQDLHTMCEDGIPCPDERKENP